MKKVLFYFLKKKHFCSFKKFIYSQKGILSYMGKMKNLVITVSKTAEIIKFLQNGLFHLNYS